MIRALIVDPDAAARQETVRLLSHCTVPCTVVGQAERGDAALELLRSTRPQLVISELELPDRPGLALLEQLQERDAPLQFLFLSERQDFFALREALRLGAADYLLKPLSREELEGALHRILRRRGSPASAHLFQSQDWQENRYVAEAVHYIASHYNDPTLTVRSISRVLDLSEGHLSRLFKEKTGYTMKNYLTRYRIGVAEDLLRDSRSRVYEAAKLVGYQDVAYFSNTFKRIVGVSPTEYRNEKP